MSKKICKSNPEFEDVAHFAIESFMQHERGQELVDAGRAMNFLSGIMHRSFHSSTSKYHTLYRQKGRVHGLTQKHDNIQDDNIYSMEQDNATEAIAGVLEDMEAGSIELWFRATLFKMYMKESNCSELSRQTKIPRTSIAKAVEEARTYIQQQLKNNNINYE
jgi:hypothetical protein